jgi:hypothetical protein
VLNAPTSEATWAKVDFVVIASVIVVPLVTVLVATRKRL